MRTIWKYPLLIGITNIALPVIHKALTVQMQRGVMMLWVAVEPDEPIETRTFRVVGTGHDMPEKALDYIATVQDGEFVWHVFKELNEIEALMKMMR